MPPRPHGFLVSASAGVHRRALRDWVPDDDVPWSWTIQQEARLGQLMLVYVTEPEQAIAWIGQLRSRAHRPSATRSRHAWAWVDMVPLPDPVSAEELWSDPVVSGWSARQSRLQGYSRAVRDAAVWAAMMNLVVANNPGLADQLAHWAATAPDPWPESLDDQVWEGDEDTDWPFPYVHERGLQLDLHDYLTTQDGLRLPRPDDGLDLPSLEARMGAAGRADIVLVDERKHDLLVVETKLFARTLEGLEQLARYEAWLQDRHAGWTIRRCLCAQLFSDACRVAAEESDVTCLLVRFPTADDGYDEEEVGFMYVTLTRSPGEEQTQRQRAEIERAARFLAAPQARHDLAAIASDAAVAPGHSGFLAVWPREERAARELGLSMSATGPIFVTWVPNLAKAIRLIPEPGGYEFELLCLHLGLATGALPIGVAFGDRNAREEALVADWMREHLALSWSRMVPVDFTTAVSGIRELMQPPFRQWYSCAYDELRARFRFDVARRAGWARSVDVWVGAGEFLRDAWLRRGDLLVAIDKAGRPVDAGGAVSDTLETRLLPRRLRDGHGPIRCPLPTATDADISRWEQLLRSLSADARLGLRASLYVHGLTVG